MIRVVVPLPAGAQPARLHDALIANFPALANALRFEFTPTEAWLSLPDGTDPEPIRTFVAGYTPPPPPAAPPAPTAHDIQTIQTAATITRDMSPAETTAVIQALIKTLRYRATLP